MTKRKTIQANPLDAVIPLHTHSKHTPTTRPNHPTTPQPAAANSSKKRRLTVHVSEDLSNRVKNAVFWTPGLTLAALAEDAFSALVAQLEQERGETFPQRTSELKGGRPVK